MYSLLDFLLGEHIELYTKNFHEVAGTDIELRGVMKKTTVSIKTLK